MSDANEFVVLSRNWIVLARRVFVLRKRGALERYPREPRAALEAAIAAFKPLVLIYPEEARPVIEDVSWAGLTTDAELT